MADQTTESILFEIKINAEQYKAEQKLIRGSLQQLTLDIEQTKSAQKLLTKERELGKLTDRDYAQQSVKLREQLKGQTADQRELEKGLATSQRAYNSAAGSAEQLRAQLFELTTAYYAMGEAERKSAEGQAVQKQALAVSDALKSIEAGVGSTGRNVGNYAASFKLGLAPVVAELVKIEQELKGVDAASEQGALLQQKRIGFMTAAQKAAAQAGITDFTQAKATIDQYTQAFTPAVENLVRVQQEQQQVGQTVGENSEQYQQLGFRVAGAQKQLDDLVSAQQAAEQASRAGGAAAQGQAAAVEVAAGSLAGLRAQLVALENTRESLDPATKEAQELNSTILELRTTIQQAEGKIDEFGERVQKNIKKENFDTVTDAVQGMVGAFSVATLVLGDNTDAAAAQAKALQLMAIAQNARAIAIGLDSAKDAALIVLLKAKSIFLREESVLTAAAAVSTEAHAAVAGADAVAITAQAEAAALNAEGQAASAVATAGSTVATETQVVAVEGATIAQRALNLALRLNPIGLIIIAVAALVGAFLAYRNASEQTQQKVRDFAKALLLFTNPIGLVYVAIEKLYQKFASVRAVLDPLIKGFELVAGKALELARDFGETIGLLDTANEKAIKAAQQQLNSIEALKTAYAQEAKALEQAGFSMEQVRAKGRQGLAEELAQRTALNKQLEAQEREKNQSQLASIARKQAANEQLSDQEQKFFEERQARNNAEKAAQIALNAYDYETIETRRAARQQEAQDFQTNAQRASQNLARRIEQQNAAEDAQLQRNISRIALRLSAVQKGTTEELRLQQQQVQAQTALQIKQATDELAEKTRLRKAYYPTELAALNKATAAELEQFGLTEQQKNALRATATQARIDLDQKYDLKAAQQAVAEIPLLQLEADAVKLKLRADFERQVNALVLQAEVTRNQAQLAQAKVGTLERRNLELTLIDQEQELAIAGLDRRAMSNLEYETRITAIRADAIGKRKALSEQDTQNVITELNAQQQAAELNQQLMLAGLTEAKQKEVQATRQYANERLRAEVNAYAAGLAATKEGTTERENVEKQHQINLKNLAQEGAQSQVAAFQAKYEQYSRIASQSLSALSTIQDAATQDQLNRINQEMNAATTSQARKAVLAKQQARIEKEQHERQQKYAIAQAVIDGGSAVMKILAETPKFDFGILTALQIAAAAITTGAQIRAISSQKFASGGIAYGPSHAQGGIQLLHRGRHAGIEIEGGEPVLTAAVSRNPVLLSMASMINQLAGGRALYRDPTPTATWARWAEGGVVSSSAAYLPQVRTGGVVHAAAAGPAIDYDLLTAKLTGAFTAGAQALPPPQLNLTDLRQRQSQQQQLDNQTNI
ncbi:hypothetical protein QMK33_19730 [Hymenobacter sp. H14-R3]|uniref:hypothetical protein n=1 Tax=Hymenobacter sp. H14-R3 TaxID=3046308 RepID=UPI0024BAC57D|nr:hypothetical protein [Hymenobacter sp. H14-R3]MDJ0367385.1 hypothetical protein [Hymenobacter sp. H14-R3]